MTTPQKAVEYARSKLGCRYSQSRRMEKDIFDCSSYVDRSYKAAGYEFQTEHNTSCYLVYDKGFDMIYPATQRDLGKKYTTIKELRENGYVPEAGDIIYINTNSDTDRANKITHVVLVEDESHILHARGLKYNPNGVRRDAIDTYDRIVAVTRFREPAGIIDPTMAKMPLAAYCTGGSVNLREAKSADSDRVIVVHKGTPMIVLQDDEKFYSVVTLMQDGVLYQGHMSKNYIRICN